MVWTTLGRPRFYVSKRTNCHCWMNSLFLWGGVWRDPISGAKPIPLSGMNARGSEYSCQWHLAFDLQTDTFRPAFCLSEDFDFSSGCKCFSLCCRRSHMLTPPPTPSLSHIHAHAHTRTNTINLSPKLPHETLHATRLVYSSRSNM